MLLKFYEEFQKSLVIKELKSSYIINAPNKLGEIIVLCFFRSEKCCSYSEGNFICFCN